MLFSLPLLRRDSWKDVPFRTAVTSASHQFPSFNISLSPQTRLKLLELLDGGTGPGQHTEDVETDLLKRYVSIMFPRFSGASSRGVKTYGLAERPALANGNLVTLRHTEGRADVRSQVVVPLLVTVVLGDVVEVFAADDQGTVHLGGDDGTGQDTAADGDETGEGALLVCGSGSC